MLASATETDQAPGRGLLAVLRGTAGPLVGLILLCVLLSLATDTFLSVRNALNILDQVTVLGVMAIGMTFVILIGGIDLSVGSVLALAMMVMGWLANVVGVPLPVSILIALAAAGLCGMVSGVLITAFRVPPFIATLAMMSVARGLANMITDGQQIVGFPDWFTTLAISRHFGILTATVALMLVILVVAAAFLRYRAAGRMLYAVGGNPEVARLAGIDVRLVNIGVYVVAAVLAGLAGIVLAARLELGAALERLRLRARHDRGRGDRRHLALRRDRHRRRHADRRPDHRRAAQRAQPAQRLALPAAGRHRRRDRPRRRRRDAPPQVNSPRRPGPASAPPHRAGPGRSPASNGDPRAPEDHWRNQMRLNATLVASAALIALSLGSAQAAEVKKIGLAVANLQANFFNQIKQSVEAEAGKKNIKVITVDAKGDGPTQINQIQDLLTQNIDALIYIPAGAAAATVPTKLAHAAGVPVVNVDRNAAGAPGDTFIATDSVASAKAVCGYIIGKAGGAGKMVIIHGQKGTTPEVDRMKGCSEAIAANPGVKVVAEQYSNIWSQDEGFQIMQNMLQAHPDVSIVFAQADALALGAAQAIKVAGPSQKVWLAGFDGDTAALEALKNGVFDVTATQQTQLMGRMAVESATKLGAGEKVPAEQLMDATLTTKENVAGFIANHP